MKNNAPFNPETIPMLTQFLDQNRSTDFLKANLLSDEVTSQLDFTSLSDKKDELIALAKAYQRLIRIIPEQNREAALTLLGQGVHSALPIAKMAAQGLHGDRSHVIHN